MLTGDNPFTAVNIAHSCGLIEKNQRTFIVTQKSRKEIKEEFDKIKEHIKKNKKRQRSESNYYFSSSESNGNEYISSSDSSASTEKTGFCLVITGDALTIVQKDQMRIDSNNVNSNDNNNGNKDLSQKKEGNDKENDLEKKNLISNPLSSPEKSGSEKSNDTIEDFKKRKEYKESNLIIAEEQKSYNADNEREYSSKSNSINNHSKNSSSKSVQIKKEDNQKKKEDSEKEKSSNKKNEKEDNLSKNIRKDSSKNFDNEGIEEGSLLNLFLEIITSTNTVVCSRVSPKQKADLISLVKKHEKENMTTLAIGDGANDVNMITAADVGIGIMGNEGQQAARASDYVIGQFSFLKRLLFVHGREAQRKNAFAIGYILWKNFLYVIPMIM